MSTYLAFMTVGKNDVKRGFSSTGHPYFTAIATESVEQEKLNLASADLERLPEVIDWSEGEFGEYPFNDIGGVVPSSEFGFALENQSRLVYSPVFWARGNPNMNVVVHETAHQWFGNSVSVAQ